MSRVELGIEAVEAGHKLEVVLAACAPPRQRRPVADSVLPVGLPSLKGSSQSG